MCDTQGLDDKAGWKHGIGDNHTPSTGPSDHTTGNGGYLHIDIASGICNSDTFSLISPQYQFDTKTDVCVSFWYQMFGTRFGKLSIDILTDGEKSVIKGWNLKGIHRNRSALSIMRRAFSSMMSIFTKRSRLYSYASLIY